MKTFLSSLLLLVLPAMIFAQTTVSGVVTETSSGLPLPGVNVLVKGTSSGTATDFDGNYQITVRQGDVLVFSYIGYITQEVTFTGQSTINMSLAEDAAKLDEVVVIGYGSIKKEDLTGSVDLVTTEDFNQGPVVSPQQLITGKVAGVSVTSAGGAPGENQNILIRGNGSLRLSSNPLIVIDGIPLDQGGVGGSRNPLNLLNPNDIESMTVLKDASATSIYGSRAANGVIIVTTKKGKDREFQFNFNTSTTMHTAIAFVDLLDADEFRQIVLTHPEADDATRALLQDYDTDWQDEIYNTAFGRDHSFSALGSLFGVPMRFSLGYTNHDGILKRDNFERTTASVNFSPSFLDDHLKIELNARGAYSENFFGNRGAMGAARGYAPTQPVYDENSPFAPYSSWVDAVTGLQPGLAGSNPVALLDLRDDRSWVNRFIANAKVDYKLHFLPELTATVNVGIDKSNGIGRILVSENIPTTDPTWNGSKNTYDNESTNKLFDAYLTYADTFNEKHNLTVVAGYSYQSFEYDNFSYNSELEEDAIETGTDIQYEFVDQSKNVLLSYFGRFNYDYDGRYLLTATLRADASSKLNPNDRWGYFPSVAVAWNIHNESFLNNSNVLNELKLRFGYGEVGNVNGLGDYVFLTRYSRSTDDANYQFGNSFYQTYRPDPINENLRWEIGNTLNLGLDYAFLNRRISGSVNVYKKETKDLIADATIDPFTNFGSRVDTNIGDMENRGIEFMIDVVPFDTENFRWSLNYNIALNENEITKLPFDQEVGGISGGVGNNIQLHTLGEPPYSFNVYQQIYGPDGRPIEGAFVDRNGDNVINDSDKYLFKDPYANVIMGLSTNLNYKKWDLAVVTRANIGNYVYNNVASSNSYLANVVPTTNDFLSNIHAAYLETGFNAGSDFNFINSHWLQEASFFRIDNITLGYTLDNAVKDAAFRIYGSVQNVATITDYTGLDPEITGGIDNNFYPRPRSFVFGVNVDF